MKEIKIQINKLGAVRDSEVIVTPLSILSGESGLGKSYVALVMHYIYTLLEQARFDTLFERNGITTETAFKNENSQLSISSSSINSWINEDVVRYMREAIGNPNLEINVDIQLPLERQQYIYECSTEIIGIAGKEEIYYSITLNKGLPFRYRDKTRLSGSIPFSILLSAELEKELEIKKYSKDVMQAFLMVPGRGTILNLNREDSSRLGKQSGMIEEFLRDWDVIKHMAPRSELPESNEVLTRRLNSINGGAIVMKNDELKYFIQELKDDIPISAAASSVKELAPLSMLLEKYPADALSILFEEPEAHLHPSKQVEIADFIVDAVNRRVHFQITTHSDYILRRINDFLFLHGIKKKDEKIYEDLITKYHYPNLTLDPQVLSAYLLEKDQTSSYVHIKKQNIIDGIPYESFYDVLSKNFMWSMDIKSKYKELYEN